jgi:hypothetical protein
MAPDMVKRCFGYSTKNIPIASNIAYQKKMMQQTEKFVKNIRWKVILLDKDDPEPSKLTYGFRSSRTPDKVELLKPLEDDLYDQVSNIEFSSRRTKFQRQLNNDVRDINASTNVLVPADKTTNLYSMSAESYKKLRDEKVTKSYNKSSCDTTTGIDREGKAIAKKLDLADRMEVYAEKESFVTLKDHKEDFKSKPKCRLINPAKSEVGIVSKHTLENINTRMRSATRSQQWKNTQSVIEWFKGLTHKANKSFIKFDIVEIYPSITEVLLEKAIRYAKTITTINEEEETIIWHSRKSLLFSGNAT